MQLSDARNKYHQNFLDQANKKEFIINKDTKLERGGDAIIWPSKTTLIVGVSIISGLNEKRLSHKDNLVKIRSFPGATVDDMYHYLVPLLKKRPDNIIIHCGTNNTIRHKPEEIVDELLKLKMYKLY